MGANLSLVIRDRSPMSLASRVTGGHFTGGVVRATLAAWLHGEVLCPSCGLPIGRRDVDQDLRELDSAQPVGAIVTHRRCGATFRLEFSA